MNLSKSYIGTTKQTFTENDKQYNTNQAEKAKVLMNNEEHEQMLPRLYYIHLLSYTCQNTYVRRSSFTQLLIMKVFFKK